MRLLLPAIKLDEIRINGSVCSLCGAVTVRLLPAYKDFKNSYHHSIRCGRLDSQSYLCDGNLATITPKKLLKIVHELALDLPPL